MSAIEAAFVKAQTLQDSTLRVTFDIEPRHAQTAFKLFATAGQPVAIAALTTASIQPQPQEQPEAIGPLCMWAVQRCKEQSFWEFLGETLTNVSIATEQEAAKAVRDIAQVESRKDLDDDIAAANRFNLWIRKPYANWLRNRPRCVEVSKLSAEH